MPRPLYKLSTYKAKVTSWELFESREKKTPGVRFYFDLLGEVPRGGAEGEILPCESGGGYLDLWLTESTAERTAEALVGLGYDRDTFDGLDPKGPRPFNFEGKILTVYNKREEFTNKNGVTETVDKWNLSGGTPKAAGEPLQSAAVRALNARFGKFLKPKAGSGNGGSTPAPVTAGAPPAEDDSETV